MANRVHASMQASCAPSARPPTLHQPQLQLLSAALATLAQWGLRARWHTAAWSTTRGRRRACPCTASRSR